MLNDSLFFGVGLALFIAVVAHGIHNYRGMKRARKLRAQMFRRRVEENLGFVNARPLL